jgi:hypothetical protein
LRAGGAPEPRRKGGWGLNGAHGLGAGAAVSEERVAPGSGPARGSSPTAAEARFLWATDWFLEASLARKGSRLVGRPLGGRIYGRNRDRSAPTCGSRGAGVPAPEPRPNSAQGWPIPLRKPVARQRSWLIPPNPGRRFVMLGRASGRWQAQKTGQKGALQPNPGEAKVALMKANGFISGRHPLAYLAKREDRQVCLITCWA